MIVPLWIGYIVSVVSAAAALALLREAAAFFAYFPRGRLTETVLFLHMRVLAFF